MLEKPPYIEERDLIDAMLSSASADITRAVEKINETYAYWDAVKYMKTPDDMTPEQLWTHVKVSRLSNRLRVWDKYGISLSITNSMQRQCHEFDMNFGGSWGSDAIISGGKEKQQYLVSSLMEEAIYSSQMEGASTTRKVAKDMLRKKLSPKDKSQRMIFNNYQTIQFIVENKSKPLSPELLLHVHRLMTEGTLQDKDDAGRFRNNNDVVVENGITHETVHTPPSYDEIPDFVQSLCDFFNDNSPRVFIHPIIRGIIVHFLVAYVHPFADGNGRTARALFYWYMMKKGYWLTEYLSISRVIAKSKKSYEKSYLYTEADGMDIGYFVSYNLRVLGQSFKQLQDYIRRKQTERQSAEAYLRIGNINERQARIIRMFVENPGIVITVKDLQNKFLVSPTTAKNDVMGLVERGMLCELSLNKVKKGYVRSDDFDDIIN